MPCNKKTNKKIYLIGYRCTGKTGIGRILAGIMDFSFIDTDEKIEKKILMPISLFVETNGWKKFREIEKLILFKTAELDNYVIATGGGIITLDENISFMKEHGIIVWLKAPADIIISRMEKDHKTADLRPSLTGKTMEEETESVLNLRTPFYQNACDFDFDTSEQSPEKIAESIKQKIRLVN